jgi:hypothetical protein
VRFSSRRLIVMAPRPICLNNSRRFAAITMHPAADLLPNDATARHRIAVRAANMRHDLTFCQQNARNFYRACHILRNEYQFANSAHS